jgi:hypothetical protein
MSTVLRLFRRTGGAPLLALWLAACGGGTEALLIPLFEFGFTGTTTGNVGVQIFFGPDQPTTATGTFSFVNMNVDGFVAQVHYTGTWSSCTFSISTADAVQAPIAASYTGRFKGNDSVELTPASGAGLPTITLQRQGVGTRVTGC